MDAEAQQNSNQDLSRAALELVKSTSFQATGFQQEVFISVQFHGSTGENLHRGSRFATRLRVFFEFDDLHGVPFLKGLRSILARIGPEWDLSYGYEGSGTELRLLRLKVCNQAHLSF